MTSAGTGTARAMLLPLALAQLIGRFPMRRAGGLRECRRRSPVQRESGGRAIGPGGEQDFWPVWVLVSNAAVVLPIVDLRNRADARCGQPCHHALLGDSIGQVEHQLIKSGCRVRRVPQADDLQVNRAGGQAEDRPIEAVAVMEGFEYRKPDGVPVEADRLVITGAPPPHTQRAHGKTLWPAPTAPVWATHGDSVHQAGRVAHAWATRSG